MKNIDRLFNTKMEDNIAEKQPPPTPNRRADLARRAIDAVCRTRPGQTIPPLPIEQIPSHSKPADNISQAIQALQQKISQFETLLEKKSTAQKDTLQQQIADLAAELKTTAEQDRKHLEALLNQKSDQQQATIERLTAETKSAKDTMSELLLTGLQQQIAAFNERLDTLADTVRKTAQPQETPSAICECCGRDDIRKNALVKIDSGQFVCPICLKALRDFRSQPRNLKLGI
ncbi:MAG: hypothetical protein PHF37_02635 [Phycisphaerae bacterium]|nr:hypothetical protein [Phycisphaerae bacterium]